MNRCVLYTRVSTADQTTAGQLHELREAARRLGLVVAAEVDETGSGAKHDRPGWMRVMLLATSRQVEAVLVWKLDRAGRSALDLLGQLRELDAAGVRFIATSQSIDVRPGGDPMSRFVLTVLAAAAEWERDLIRERTRAGLARVKRSGSRSGRAIGRPRASAVLLHAAADLVAAGTAVRAAARAKGVREATLRRFLRANAGEGRAEGEPDA